MLEENGPLEGFDVIERDVMSGVITIQIDAKILADPAQQEALVRKLIEAMKFDSGITKLSIVPRRGD